MEKYALVDPKESPERHLEKIPPNSLEAIRPHEFRYWIKKDTDRKYIRILPNYSAETAKYNIENHPFKKFSRIFNRDMIIIPPSEVSVHYEPDKRLMELKSIIFTMEHIDNDSPDKLEKEALEVALILEQTFDIPVSNIGISGSLLWKAHHEKSDLDFMIYGYDNVLKIMRRGLMVSPEGRRLRRYLKVEMLPIAEKMSFKTGLPFEECFEYIFYKPYLFFYGKRKISITFAPDRNEIPFIPLYTKNSRFIDLGVINIKARIKNDRWGFYYPGLFGLSEVEIIDFQPYMFHNEENKAENNGEYSGLKEQYLESGIDLNKNITRLLVFEHELVGYYRKGDLVEVKGLLQIAQNVPPINENQAADILHIPREHTTLQIIVGTFELFGNEFVRRIRKDKR